MNPKYPVYIPSLGRWESRLTSKALDRLGVPYRVAVEPKEYDNYNNVIHADKLLKLPDNFSEQGKGSIPVRNWVWEHSIKEGYDRHWLIDDNIVNFYRLNLNRRIPVGDGTIFKCAEDFTNRYENVAFSGLNNIAFAPDRNERILPYQTNTRIYSITLINNNVPYRWRGKFNEDTDLCLRAMKDGWCTIQFNAFLADKSTTMKMKGGNTDGVYGGGDQRRAFAESLAEQHPDVAKVVWKFNRWHHQVDYSLFKKNKLKKKAEGDYKIGVDNYGMKLVLVNA